MLEALSTGATTSGSSLTPHTQFCHALHGSKKCQHGPQAPSSVVLRPEPSWPAVFGGGLCLATCCRCVTVLGAGGDPVVQGGHAQPARPGWPRHTRPSRCARISLAGVMDGAAELHACFAHSKLENPCTINMSALTCARVRPSIQAREERITGLTAVRGTDTVRSCIDLCDVDVRRDLYNGLVLAGSACCISLLLLNAAAAPVHLHGCGHLKAWLRSVGPVHSLMAMCQPALGTSLQLAQVFALPASPSGHEAGEPAGTLQLLTSFLESEAHLQGCSPKEGLAADGCHGGCMSSAVIY